MPTTTRKTAAAKAAEIAAAEAAAAEAAAAEAAAAGTDAEESAVEAAAEAAAAADESADESGENSADESADESGENSADESDDESGDESGDESADDESEFSFDTVTVAAVKELPTGTRDTAPNPMEKHVKAAVDQAARGLRVPTGKRAAEAARLIRRAAANNNYSIRLRFTDLENESLTPAKAEASTVPVFVYFKVSSEKKDRVYTPRKYNNATIREWANLGDDGKITKEIRQAFRKTHGFDSRER